MRGSAGISWALALSTVLLVAVPLAWGGFSDNLLYVQACVGGSCYGYTLFTPDDPRGSLVYDPGTQTWTWTLLQDVPIMSLDGQLLMGTLQSPGTTVTFGQDPAVNLNFAVEAGPEEGGTEFTIRSALLSFPTIANAMGRSSAAYTLTDGVDDDGATLSPLAGEDGAYKAQYNGFVPDGTTFAQLIPQMIAGPMGTTSLSQDYPGGGAYEMIPAESVYDMSSQVSFALTPNDLASGTTIFEIIPEPTAGLGLVLLGVMTLGWRKR
jgi:hypothetical protein